MHTKLAAAAIVSALVMPFGGVAMAQSADPEAADAAVANADGADVGSVTWTQGPGAVTVAVAVHGLPPGFHGFHVHAVGECAAPFTSAGPHLNPDGVTHPDHAADQPVLLVNADGTGSASFVTDRYAVADRLDRCVAVPYAARHDTPPHVGKVPCAAPAS